MHPFWTAVHIAVWCGSIHLPAFTSVLWRRTVDMNNKKNQHHHYIWLSLKQFIIIMTIFMIVVITIAFCGSSSSVFCVCLSAERSSTGCINPLLHRACRLR